MTAFALFALWGASWALSYVDLGAYSWLIAFGIAVAKGALVVWNFMEMARESVSIHATLLAALAMVAVLIFFMVADVKTRSDPIVSSPSKEGPMPPTGIKF